MFRPSFVLRSRVVRSQLVAPLFCVVFLLPACARATVNQSSSTPKSNPPAVTPLVTPEQALLPGTFAGWQIAGTPQRSTNPSAADTGDAAVLQEYGFTRYEAANYSRDGGKLTVKAIEFGDATGAYGVFTFYRQPNMHAEQIGQGAAFDGQRVLFWKGAVLVDAKFAHLTPMSAAELRDLAQHLPPPLGNAATLPTLPNYLPQKNIEPMTVQYAIGPQAYRLSGGVLPPALVDFDRSAEVVAAQYNAFQGTGTLTIINYPTPEIAIDQERAIRAYLTDHGTSQGQMQNPWTPALANSNPAAIQMRRSGPLLAITSGGFSAQDAQQILQSVHYEVNLTMSNSGRYVSDPARVAQLILNVAMLVGIFALIAIVAGVSLGGGRVMWRRMHGKPGWSEDGSAEFIRLNLKD